MGSKTGWIYLFGITPPRSPPKQGKVFPLCTVRICTEEPVPIMEGEGIFDDLKKKAKKAVKKKVRQGKHALT